MMIVLYMPGCGGCVNYITHHAETLHAQFGNVLFIYLDITNPNLKQSVDKFGITSVPTFVFVHTGEGKSFKQIAGYHETAIKQLLASM